MVSAPPRSVELLPKDAWVKYIESDDIVVWVVENSLVESVRFTENCDPLRMLSSTEMVRRIKADDFLATVTNSTRGGTLSIRCGPRCSERLYLSGTRNIIRVYVGINSVPDDRVSAPLSPEFFAAWMANAMSFGPCDLFCGHSPFANLWLIGRGITAEVAANQWPPSVSFIDAEDRPGSAHSSSRVSDAIEECSQTLKHAVMRAARDIPTLSECSGGIDSGVVAAMAANALGARFCGGTFTRYPYYEFRDEERYAEAIARRSGFKLFRSDAMLSLPWGAWPAETRLASGAEPSLQLASLGQVLAAARVLAFDTPLVILTGHGGDLLFSLSDFPISQLRHEIRPLWITAALWSEIAAYANKINEWTSSDFGLRAGLRLDNPWLSRIFSECHSGSVYYSPLSARPVVEAVLTLSDLVRQEGTVGIPTNVQKPLAYMAFADLLPELVWRRRWKVNHIGLSYRFWLKRGADLRRVVAGLRWVSECLGIDHGKFIKAIGDMPYVHGSSNKLLEAAASYFMWIHHFTLSREFRDSSAGLKI